MKRLLRLQLRDRARIGEDVDDEIAFHLEMRARELVAGGVAAAAARRQAEREFGDIAAARAHLISSDLGTARRRGWHDALSDALRDVRLATRSLVRARLFSVVATLTLAVGIGANTALFSIFDGVVLRPLPYAAADRLVAVAPEQAFLRAEFALLRDRARSYDELASYWPGAGVGVAGHGDPVRVTAALVSANLFTALGAQPAIGRGFTRAEEHPSQGAVVVLSHGAWHEWFGGARDAVGGTLIVDGVVRTVIGVMPARFGFPSADTRLWLPVELDPADVGSYWGIGNTRLLGRLRAGVEPEAARQELVALAAELRLENPLWTPNEPYRADATVVTLADRLSAPARGMLLLLLGATGFVLLIACANVGNLFLVRMLARQRDIAVRSALGGGRGAIVRAIGLESTLLAVAGGALGVLVAHGLMRAVLPLLPPDTPRLEQIAIDARVLLFALATTLAAALLFSLLPALRMAGGALHGTLRDGTRGIGAGRGTRRLARGVVAGEVALAVALLLGAALLLRSMQELHAIDPGFRDAGAVAARIAPPPRLLPDAASRLAFHTRVLDRVTGSAGVSEAALAGQLPFDGEASMTAAAVEHVTLDPNELPMFDFRPVSPAFFAALGMPVLHGRAFDDRDRAGTEPVAIVDATAAQRFWPGEDPIGRRIGRPWLREWLTIVGVVPSVRNNDLLSEPLPAIYVPFAQQPSVLATLIVRSDRPLGATAELIRGAVREADATVPVAYVRPLDALVRASVSDTRAVALLLSAFAAVALVLGALGIYGVLAYSVQQRVRELGVRLALGATRADVRRLVLRDGAALLAAGLAFGVPLALALGRLMSGFLYGVRPTDPATLLAAPLVLAVVGLLAAYLPALRASRVDPAVTLRGE